MTLKYYLIASEENDYEPWIMKPIALAIFMIIIWSLRILGPTITTFAQSSIDPADLMNRVNLERTQRFIPSLTHDSRLTSAAVAKSNDMIARSYFAHINPDGNYIWPTIETAGYTPYLALGENLAMDFSSASAVVQAWMDSPTHRSNIVNTIFQDQGMGSVFGLFSPGHNSVLITNTFGTLQKPTPPPAIAPASVKPSYTTPINSETPQATEPEIEKKPENISPPLAQKDGLGPRSSIPVSEKALFMPFYRNIIMTLAIIYLLILAVDSFIIYRNKIRRTNRQSSPHALIFALIIIINLFITLY
jgi:hypothetical protein